MSPDKREAAGSESEGKKNVIMSTEGHSQRDLKMLQHWP